LGEKNREWEFASTNAPPTKPPAASNQPPEIGWLLRNDHLLERAAIAANGNDAEDMAFEHEVLE